MKKASITQTKNQLSALLDAVRHGETILIMDRDQPVARLEPVNSTQGPDPMGYLAQLERNGLIRRALTQPSKRLLRQAPPRAKKGASILEALRADREEAR